MKIFTSAQIHELDKYTIEHEPITSLNLMERAAKALTRAIEEEWSNSTPVVVFAGPGNNGGDALAVARLLSEDGYQVSVFLFNVHNKLSADCATNKKRLIEGKARQAVYRGNRQLRPSPARGRNARSRWSLRQRTQQAAGGRIRCHGEIHQPECGQGREHRPAFGSDERGQLLQHQRQHHPCRPDPHPAAEEAVDADGRQPAVPGQTEGA